MSISIFFFSDEKTVIENPFKDFWLLPSTFFNQLHIKPSPTIQHHEVLFHLDSCRVQNSLYYHLDAHHDLYSNGKRLDALPAGLRAGFVTEANFLAFAIRDGIIANLVSVCPDWAEPQERADELKNVLGGSLDRVRFVRFSDIYEELKMLQFDFSFCSFSPVFTPKMHVQQFASITGATHSLIEPVIVQRQNELSAGFTECGFKFYYNLPSNTIYDNQLLFHGSDIKHLHALEPFGNKALFVSPSPGFAACFAVHPANESGWVQGIDKLTSDWPFSYMVYPSNGVERLKQPFSLYRAYARDIHNLKPDGCVHGMEFSTTQSINELRERVYSSTETGLHNLGVYISQCGNQAITDPDILQYLELYSFDVVKHFEMPLEAIHTLSFMPFLLYQFFVSHKKVRPSVFKPSYRKHWLDLLHRVILPGAFPFSKIPHNGYHSMEHCHHVAQYAAYFALLLDEDPIPAMVAGALHDIMRLDDSETTKHAEDAAELAEQILCSLYKDFVNVSDFPVIVEAIRTHPLNTTPNNYVDACLRDADRLRLAWEHGYNGSYFTTKQGKNSAHYGYVYHKNNFYHYFKNDLTEVKVEITEKCNLSCSFCHQTFGIRKNGTEIELDKFEDLVLKAKSDGIRMLRLTGGEPFLHRNVESFAKIAKANGFYVSINTNATIGAPERYLELTEYVDCFKISLPFPDLRSSTVVTGSSHAWEKKLDVIGHLYAYGIEIEVLTVMTAQNILEFDRFVALLSPLESIKWLPLRAEPNIIEPRPVGSEALNILAKKIIALKLKYERWADLFLHLAVPYCVLEDPKFAPQVFTGRRTCGPIQSLTVTSLGSVISCYSERTPINLDFSFEKAATSCLHNDFTALPICCQTCNYGFVCNGGCRTELALQDSDYGRIDYLANPDRIKNWQLHEE